MEKYFKGDDLAQTVWKDKYRHGEESVEEFFNRLSNSFFQNI